MKIGTTVKASDIKSLVESGKSLDEICAAYIDANSKPMSKGEAKNILNSLGLKIKRQRVPKFTLVNDLGDTVTVD